MSATPTRRALFLDRDGVVNREQGYVWTADVFEILPEFIALARAYTQAGYAFVIITNQGGIGKGLYGWPEVETLHAILNARLSAEGILLPTIYCCPHHPSSSHCLCRKPSPLLFERALALGGYDAGQCIMLGDRVRDVIPARALGMHTVLITTHADEEGAIDAAHHQVSSMAEATEILLARLN